MKELLFCLFIFFGRALDVSIGSIRVVFLVKGRSFLAALLSFIEIIIWFVVIQKIIINKINILELCCYALGYSFGTYIGTFINKKYVEKR